MIAGRSMIFSGSSAAFVVAGAVLAACRGGADARDFALLDLDGDGLATSEEFSTWGRDYGLLDAFVEPSEKTVGESALARGLFQIWNIEGTGITENEWNEGAKIWFPDMDLGAFTQWDIDRNGILDEQEMVAGLSHTEGLRSLDADGNGQIAPNELLTHFYKVFDGDGDGRLDVNEWSAGLDRWSWPV